MPIPTNRRVRLTPLLAALTLGLSLPGPLALAQSVPAAAQSAPIASNVLPERTLTQVLPAKTLVLVVVVNHLKSGDVHVGDAVFYKSVTNVYGPNHQILIPAGAEGHGLITKSDKAGMAGKSGKLDFTCDYVTAADNSHVAFADPDLSKAGRSYNPVTIALIAGPLSLFGKGKNIDVDEGAPLVMAVGSDIAIIPSTIVLPDQIVTIVPDKHKGKKMLGTVKSFDAETITINTEGADKVMKLKDIKQIMLPVPLAIGK